MSDKFNLQDITQAISVEVTRFKMYLLYILVMILYRWYQYQPGNEILQ